MTEVKQWIRDRRTEGMLWKDIRDKLMTYNYTYMMASDLVNEVRAETENQSVNAQTQVSKPLNLTCNTGKSDNQSDTEQQSKQDNRITIRLTEEEIDFIGDYSPSQVIHKVLRLAIDEAKRKAEEQNA